MCSGCVEAERAGERERDLGASAAFHKDILICLEQLPVKAHTDSTGCSLCSCQGSFPLNKCRAFQSSSVTQTTRFGWHSVLSSNILWWKNAWEFGYMGLNPSGIKSSLWKLGYLLHGAHSGLIRSYFTLFCNHREYMDSDVQPCVTTDLYDSWSDQEMDFPFTPWVVLKNSLNFYSCRIII